MMTRDKHGVSEDPIVVGFGLFLFPESQKAINFQKQGTQNRTKVTISSIFGGLGLFFLVWNHVG